MARGFRREGKAYEAELEDAELRLVLTLMEQARQIVLIPESDEPEDPFEALMRRAGLTDTAVPESHIDAELLSNDPAMDRLIPEANREDPEVATEFRRLTARGIRERKATTLQDAIEALSRGVSGDTVRIDREAAENVLVALTDVRLIMGERLGLHTEDDVEELERRVEEAGADPEDVDELTMALYYDFVTWLQETIATSLLSDIDPSGRDDG